MTATGLAGMVAFGPQTAMGADPTQWFFHAATDTDLSFLDDQRMGPIEVGGRPMPKMAYKNGYSVAGGLTFNPRLEGSLGMLLQGALGLTPVSKPAIAFDKIMAKTAVTTALQTINTGLNPLPVPATGSKLAVRIYKTDSYSYKPTITITGTTASAATTETFNFGSPRATIEALPQRIAGIDTDPTSGAEAFETIVSKETWKTVTSVGIPAEPGVTGLAPEMVYVSVGYEDAVGMTHSFTIDNANPSLVKWMGFRKFIPPGSNGGASLGETYKDCKVLGLGLTFPNTGLISARIDAEGRDMLLAQNPSWTTNYEDYTSVPVSAVVGGYFNIPGYSGANMKIVNATVGWANQPLGQEDERSFGNPMLDDITVVGRQLVFDIIVKWQSPDMYQMILSGSKVGTSWGSTPFTTRLDINCLAPGLMPGSLVPYSLRVQSQKVLLAQRGGITLAGRNAVMMRFTGTAMDVGGAYAQYDLTNLKNNAYYTWA